MSFVTVQRGPAPLIVTFPHTGTQLPPEIAARFVSPDVALKDTDWRVDTLYGFARGLGATLVHTTISRSAIDVNRDPSGASLYPGQATTGLTPFETFDGESLYRDGEEPDLAEVASRRQRWFEPFHAALAAEIARAAALHRRVVVYDCHSIRSRVPRLFPGDLPIFNIGTYGGTSCDLGLREAVTAACAASGESHVVDGRFKGGWITRHYGAPERGIHAIQMELAQRFYLDEAHPTVPDVARAARAEALLAPVLGAALAWAKA